MGGYVLSACSMVFGRIPHRVLATIDRDPAMGIDRLSSALMDYGDAHASITVSTQAGPAGRGTHQLLSILGSTGWLRMDYPLAQAVPTACHLFIGDVPATEDSRPRPIAFEPVNQYTLQADRFSRYPAGRLGSHLADRDGHDHDEDYRQALRLSPVQPVGTRRVTLTPYSALQGRCHMCQTILAYCPGPYNLRPSGPSSIRDSPLATARIGEPPLALRRRELGVTQRHPHPAPGPKAARLPRHRGALRARRRDRRRACPTDGTPLQQHDNVRM